MNTEYDEKILVLPRHGSLNDDADRGCYISITGPGKGSDIGVELALNHAQTMRLIRELTRALDAEDE